MPAAGLRLSAEPQHERANLREAAVLIVVTAGVPPRLWLTERSPALRHHAGQISFAGGRLDPEDADARSAALREAQEEIGLAPDRVELLGALDAYRTVTGFRVTPFVGWVADAPAFVAEPGEVARLLSVTAERALDPDQFCRFIFERGGQSHEVLALDAPEGFIWGTTAGMLFDLASRLAAREGRAASLPPIEDPPPAFARRGISPAPAGRAG